MMISFAPLTADLGRFPPRRALVIPRNLACVCGGTVEARAIVNVAFVGSRRDDACNMQVTMQCHSTTLAVNERYV